MKKSISLMGAAFLLSSLGIAQIRPTDKSGINVFESKKVTDSIPFDGIKVDIGGSFTQSFQSLKHSNTANPNSKWDGVIIYNTTTHLIDETKFKYVDQNKLTPLVAGFNTANANLYLNTQLADGIVLNMTLYLSARHHNETWVKGGYIQFDKIPFIHLDLLDKVMEFTTLKVGHMEVNYGDAHFRRSDNGNSMYNPFMENYIMDEFATEIGAEADFQYNGLLAVVAATNGEIKGDITEVAPVDGATSGKHNPAFIGKLGIDKQIGDNLRVRLTGSGYYTAGSISNTLFGGDRSGSHYYGVMDYAAPSTSNAFSGRYNPGFSDKVTTFMGNLFVKFHGLEWFSTVESASGRAKAEITGERKATQLASDLVFRFGSDENFWLGARYNTVTAGVAAATPYDINIDRTAISAGWFVTKNIMAKAEYVTQNYNDFPASDIRNGGKFNGFVVEAVVGF